MNDPGADAEQARAVFELINEEGFEAALPFIDPEFEMTTPPNLASEPDTFTGHDGLRRWFDSFYEAMDEVRILPIELRPAGPERVAITFELVARGRTSGLESRQRAAMLSSLRDGRLLRIEYFDSIEDAEAEGRSR
jgi:ketosteroid isomerase-like protein